MSRFIGFVPRQMGSKASPVALWKHLLSLLPSAQEMADSSQRLDRVSALVQTGFCGWQESVLGTAAQINFRELPFGVKCNHCAA
jgi:hypothetical protein